MLNLYGGVCRTMATRRRPRTRVYDCNFNIGQSYYKPVMDSLDRKYSGRPDVVTPVAERLTGRESSPGGRANRLMAEFENGIESHRPSRAQFTTDDDAEIDAEFEATMKRIKSARAARTAELEEDFNNLTTSNRKKLNIADQLLDSVGLNSKTQRAIEDEVLYKQKSSARKFFDDEDDKVMTKWTAVRPGAKAMQEAEDFAEESSAAIRARKSRARLDDIDAELEDLAARGAARQKRITDLRALIDEESEGSSSLKVSKRMSVKSTAEKKQVTF